MANEIDEDQVVILFLKIHAKSCNLAWGAGKEDQQITLEVLFNILERGAEVALYVFRTTECIALVKGGRSHMKRSHLTI